MEKKQLYIIIGVLSALLLGILLFLGFKVCQEKIEENKIINAPNDAILKIVDIKDYTKAGIKPLDGNKYVEVTVSLKNNGIKKGINPDSAWFSAKVGRKKVNVSVLVTPDNFPTYKDLIKKGETKEYNMVFEIPENSEISAIEYNNKNDKIKITASK